MSPIALLIDLVQIPSVNPDGDPGTPHVGEGQMAGFLKGWLENAGAEAELQEVFPGRPNIVAKFPSDRPGKPKLLLAPHTDTVSVVGMTVDPFSGDIRDGKVWGRGASDTKGPMAAMLVAIQNLGKDIDSLTHEIWFAGLMGEEAGLHGSKALAARESFDFVIVGEPTGMCAVHAHKGSAWLRVTATGRSVHASTPEAGSNAIDKMTDALSFLREVFSEKTAKIHDPALGHSTLSTGIISGGSKINIVPNHCEALVDCRVVPGFEINEVIKAVRERHPGVEIDCKFAPPLFTKPDHPIMTLLGSLGIPAATAPWFCDAASFGERGTPAIALGPGSIAQAHTADEFISISDLEAGAAGFERFLRSLRV